MCWARAIPRKLSLVLLVAALTSASGCGSSEPSSEGQPVATDREEKSSRIIGLSLCDKDTPWREQIAVDVVAAAEAEDDVEVIVKDAQGNREAQLDDVEKFIADGVDALIVYPCDAQTLTVPVAKAYEGGTPVVVLHRALIGDKFSAFLAVDDRRIGEAVGNWLMQKLDNEGMIVELKGSSDSSRSQQRRDGFREAVNHPDVRVLFEVDMLWSEEAAREEMSTVLGEYEEIDAVFAHNDAGAYGAYQAAKEVGRAKAIVFVGIDALPDRGLKWVREGILDASFQYPTGGREAVDAVMKALAGEQPPRRIRLDSRYFTPDNLDRGGAPLP